MTKLSTQPPLTANRLLAAVLKKLHGGAKNASIVKAQIIIQNAWVSELMEAKNGNATIVDGGFSCQNIAANGRKYKTAGIKCETLSANHK